MPERSKHPMIWQLGAFSDLCAARDKHQLQPPCPVTYNRRIVFWSIRCCCPQTAPLHAAEEVQPGLVRCCCPLDRPWNPCVTCCCLGDAAVTCLADTPQTEGPAAAGHHSSNASMCWDLCTSRLTCLLLPEPLLDDVLQAGQLPALSQLLKVLELLLAVGQVQGLPLDVLQDWRELRPAAQQQGPPQRICVLKSVPQEGALQPG